MEYADKYVVDINTAGKKINVHTLYSLKKTYIMLFEYKNLEPVSDGTALVLGLEILTLWE